MIARPSLLMLTAAAAGLAVVANVVNAAAPAATPTTRLGVSIDADVTARDKAAVRRKRTLDLRENAARATEARLKAGIAAQKQAAVPPAQTGIGASEAGDQFEDLARIYQAMKPARAAVVFEQLDMDVQMKVAQRMRERSTGMIMAAMTPRGAAALSMALARRRAPRGPAGAVAAR